ncbi:MAG: hypothetical protein K1W10_02095 [Lachnospiraceae bacterium]
MIEDACRIMGSLISRCKISDDVLDLEQQVGSCGGIAMAGRIVGLISCVMCAIPFLIIAIYDKDSKEPIKFWSGDTTLKAKVKNVKDYNREMARLYQRCSIAFLITGIGFIVTPIVGAILICFDCTFGIYLMYRNYKRILSLYSQVRK